jgi:response regulator RpfG family c-di-GMP phosphodiesterase
MLIDDDVLTNFLNKIIIENAAVTCHVQRCTSVELALEYLAAGLKKKHNFPLPELILLDLSLVQESGWKFIEHFKLLKKGFKKPPLVFILTGKGDIKDEVKAADLPEISEYYSKPLTPLLLTSIMKSYFSVD